MSTRWSASASNCVLEIFIKILGRWMLENRYYANVRIGTMLIQLCSTVCKQHVLASLLCWCLCLPCQSKHVKQVRKVNLVRGTVKRMQVAKQSHILVCMHSTGGKFCRWKKLPGIITKLSPLRK